jgi:hypothetical protein
MQKRLDRGTDTLKEDSKYWSRIGFGKIAKLQNCSIKSMAKIKTISKGGSNEKDG